jgi:hypothetical protein
MTLAPDSFATVFGGNRGYVLPVERTRAQLDELLLGYSIDSKRLEPQEVVDLLVQKYGRDTKGWPEQVYLLCQQAFIEQEAEGPEYENRDSFAYLLVNSRFDITNGFTIPEFILKYHFLEGSYNGRVLRAYLGYEDPQYPQRHRSKTLQELIDENADLSGKSVLQAQEIFDKLLQTAKELVCTDRAVREQHIEELLKNDSIVRGMSHISHTQRQTFLEGAFIELVYHRELDTPRKESLRHITLKTLLEYCFADHWKINFEYAQEYYRMLNPKTVIQHVELFSPEVEDTLLDYIDNMTEDDIAQVKQMRNHNSSIAQKLEQVITNTFCLQATEKLAGAQTEILENLFCCQIRLPDDNLRQWMLYDHERVASILAYLLFPVGLQGFRSEDEELAKDDKENGFKWSEISRIPPEYFERMLPRTAPLFQSAYRSYLQKMRVEL